MKIIVYTERGNFFSKEIKLTKEEVLTAEGLIQTAINQGNYFQMETSKGTVVISGELLKTAVFEIVN